MSGYGEAPIPPLVLKALERYRETGLIPGSFTTAVLCGNFQEAVGRADPDSFAALRTIAQWIHWEIPADAHGSPEKVRAYSASKRGKQATKRLRD